MKVYHYNEFSRQFIIHKQFELVAEELEKLRKEIKALKDHIADAEHMAKTDKLSKW